MNIQKLLESINSSEKLVTHITSCVHEKISIQNVFQNKQKMIAWSGSQITLSAKRFVRASLFWPHAFLSQPASDFCS